ncbi:endonuclease/exonuclease/phosphatase family protein [Streptomyces sp. HPF1205]|uniref:endonuclease/exonuclease/phosphatase family protein n=1 Tax=Streptomyces sp. HPF1205 TaxID=2873262 RepID=UPI001CEC5FAC|nr:endonuclease/exonuclease/phosphatase family protein [Streptomyces sp. HPF1205]
MPFDDAATRSAVDKSLASPPQRTQHLLGNLRDTLRGRLPARRVDENVLVGTWNIRCFGDLNEQWHARSTDQPMRDLESLRCIAEIVSHFDVVAVQEVRANMKALRHMMKALGPDWGFILTEVNRGRAGNDERMAFVFDTRRAKPSGLAGELTLPERVRKNSPDFARRPYAVSFRCGAQTLVLVTLHIRFGQPEDRLPELLGIAEWLRDWAKTESEWGHNLIVLGDMNIGSEEDPLYKAFTSTGLRPPAELRKVPRTVFTSDTRDAFYDQIAWFHEEDGNGRGHRPVLSMRFTGNAGFVDFGGPILSARRMSLHDLSWRISDHYPLWVEFATDPATDPAADTAAHTAAASATATAAHTATADHAAGPRRRANRG